MDQAKARALLDREQQSALSLLATLTRDFTGIVDASADSNAMTSTIPKARRSRSNAPRSAR